MTTPVRDHRYRFTLPLGEHVGATSWHVVTLQIEAGDDVTVGLHLLLDG